MKMQAMINVLKENSLRKDTVKVFPFNPNFITDYKGYTLGMSVEEIDRLHAFRATAKYINTPEDFQKVTQVSDSLLMTFAPFFKFPEWTKKSEQYSVRSERKPKSNDKAFEIKDLNVATAEDLKAINGIGEKLSARIVKFRDRLGGFLVDEQLYDVYGLEPNIAKQALTRFKVFNKPVIQKININTSSAHEISSLVYIKYAIALEIVSFREANGNFSNLNELENILDLPSEKIDRIALYLSL